MVDGLAVSQFGRYLWLEAKRAAQATISGHAVRQEIAARAETQHIPIVIVTGNSDPIDAPCVLRKPVSMDTLVKTVRNCLDSKLRPICRSRGLLIPLVVSPS
jgi:hypothetical protein